MRQVRYAMWGVVAFLALTYLVPLADAVEPNEPNPFPLAILADGSLGGDDEDIFAESVASKGTRAGSK